MVWLVQLSVQNICFLNLRFNLPPILSENALIYWKRPPTFPNLPPVEMWSPGCLFPRGSAGITRRISSNLTGNLNSRSCFGRKYTYMLIEPLVLSFLKCKYIGHYLAGNFAWKSRTLVATCRKWQIKRRPGGHYAKISSKKSINKSEQQWTKLNTSSGVVL